MIHTWTMSCGYRSSLPCALQPMWQRQQLCRLFIGGHPFFAIRRENDMRVFQLWGWRLHSIFGFELFQVQIGLHTSRSTGQLWCEIISTFIFVCVFFFFILCSGCPWCFHFVMFRPSEKCSIGCFDLLNFIIFFLVILLSCFPVLFLLHHCIKWKMQLNVYTWSHRLVSLLGHIPHRLVSLLINQLQNCNLSIYFYLDVAFGYRCDTLRMSLFFCFFLKKMIQGNHILGDCWGRSVCFSTLS